MSSYWMNYRNVGQKLEKNFFMIKNKTQELSFILSMDWVLISMLILGSLLVESMIVVADDDAEGDDETPLW